MTVDSYRQSINDSLQAFALQIEKFLEIFWKTIKQIYKELADATSGWQCPIEFTTLQCTILKILIVLLLITAALIAYSWKIYGKVITEKFVKPSKCTLQEIEELKQSVAKLKLPKEHTPRI